MHEQDADQVPRFWGIRALRVLRRKRPANGAGLGTDDDGNTASTTVSVTGIANLHPVAVANATPLGTKAPVTVTPLKGRFRLGPFEIEYVTLTHSIPEPNGLAIRTPLGVVLHTGDWKIDPDPLIGEDFDQKKSQWTKKTRGIDFIEAREVFADPNETVGPGTPKDGEER